MKLLRHIGQTLMAGGLAVTLLATPVLAQPTDQICAPMDSGKIDVTVETTEITLTAPEGTLIDSYCVKAGSAEQGLGAEYYVLDPAVATVTITHSSGKDISHYAYGLVDVEETTTTTTTTTTSTTTSTTTTTTTPATTTTVPEPGLEITLYCEWNYHDAATGVHEPVRSFWDYDTKDADVLRGKRFIYAFFDRVTGEMLGSTEFGLTTPGWHDTWIESPAGVPVPDTGFIVEFYEIPDGAGWDEFILLSVLDDPTCVKDVPEETTTTTVPESTTTTTVPEDEPECTEGHPTYNAETGTCELPFTGTTDLLPIFMLGLAMTGVGVGMVRRFGDDA